MLPSGLSINSATGLITGTPPFGSATVRSVTLIVTDGQAPTTKNFTWTIVHVNRAPTVTQPVNQTNAENASVSLQVVATDPDAGDTLTYSATNLPDGLTINPTTGLISGTLTYASAALSPYTVTVTATDRTPR